MANPQSPANNVWLGFAPGLGYVLVYFSLLPFVLSGYLAFANYWVQTRWTRAEATVLNDKFRQSSSGATTATGSSRASSTSYFVHCIVSYPVAGEIRQSQLDSPPSTYRMDAQAWAASWSPGRHIAIRYKSSNPSRIRLVNNPSEFTVMGSLRAALYFFVPGLLLIWTRR